MTHGMFNVLLRWLIVTLITPLHMHLPIAHATDQDHSTVIRPKTPLFPLREVDQMLCAS
jgi:hypothetical protein